MQNINEFLNYIHKGDRSEIRVYRDGKMKPIAVSDIEIENKYGDIYFVVNSGGSKDAEINKFNAVFIDLDCGKDKNEDYYNLDVVQKYKNEKLQEIHSFSLKPTFIIDTRNGLHAYWILKENIDIDIWRECTYKLIKKFDSDIKVKNPARLMRIPYTYWMKDKANPFYTRIIEFNDISYDSNTILSELSNIDISEIFVQDNDNIYNINISCTNKPINIDINSQYLISAIKSKDISLLKTTLNINTTTTLQNKQEFYNYIYKINFSSLIGIKDYKSFCCIFHNDRNPSASIFQDPATKNYLYHCNSNSCGVTYNIVQLLQVLTKWKTHEVLEFIKGVYQIEVNKTEWQKEQISMLETNKEMLTSGAFEHSYPEVYKLIKRYIPQLITMIEIAIMNVRDENYTDSNGDVVFFVSNSYLMSELNHRQPTRLNQRNILFAFLNLLKRLDKNEIPEADLKKALEIKEKYNHHKMVNYFSIGDYDVFKMKESESRAKTWRENNMSMTGLSYEGIYRTFGQDVAVELYPQHKNTFIKTSKGYEVVKRTTSKASDERTNEIAIAMMNKIDSKNYVVEKEIIEELGSKYGKAFTFTQIKRSLQEILDSYDLQRIRCNKQIKEKYNVDSLGYPFIIVRNED